MIEESVRIVEAISDLVRSSRGSFGKVKVIDEAEITALLEDLHLQLSNDYKQSRVIANNREVILKDANEKAAKIEQEARERARQLTEENAITVSARRLAGEIEHNAKVRASQIIEEAQQKADALRKQTETDLDNKKQVTRNYIEGKISTADKLISDTISQFDGYANVMVDILDDMRRLYDGINGLEEFGYFDTSAADAQPDEYADDADDDTDYGTYED